MLAHDVKKTLNPAARDADLLQIGEHILYELYMRVHLYVYVAVVTVNINPLWDNVLKKVIPQVQLISLCSTRGMSQKYQYMYKTGCLMYL